MLHYNNSRIAELYTKWAHGKVVTLSLESRQKMVLALFVKGTVAR
jgi:hypothetical protein